MNGAQVVGLVQARLQKRQLPQGPWAVLPLSYFTRALESQKRTNREELLAKVEDKVAGWSLEGDIAFLQPR